MVTRELLSLEENAQLEFSGATQRLLLAHQALADFESKTTIVVSGSTEELAVDCAADVLRSDSAALERELHTLLLEVDSARRQYEHCFQQCLQYEKTPTPR